jgi:hypothetical protein
MTDQDFPPGMMGVFETKFHAHFDNGDSVVEFTDFEEARRTVLWDGSRPIRIDRIETIWLHKDLLKDTND